MNRYNAVVHYLGGRFECEVVARTSADAFAEIRRLFVASFPDTRVTRTSVEPAW